MMRSIRDFNPDPLEKGIAKRISYEEHQIGERVVASKMECVWKFAFGDSERKHKLVLIHSLITAKKVVELDGRREHTEGKHKLGRWSFMLDLMDSQHLLEVVINEVRNKQEPKYDLFIDRIPFRRLDLGRGTPSGGYMYSPGMGTIRNSVDTSYNPHGNQGQSGARKGPASQGRWGPDGYQPNPAPSAPPATSSSLPAYSTAASSSYCPPSGVNLTTNELKKSVSVRQQRKRPDSGTENGHRRTVSDSKPPLNQAQPSSSNAPVDLLGFGSEVTTEQSAVAFDPIVQRQVSQAGRGAPQTASEPVAAITADLSGVSFSMPQAPLQQLEVSASPPPVPLSVSPAPQIHPLPDQGTIGAKDSWAVGASFTSQKQQSSLYNGPLPVRQSPVWGPLGYGAQAKSTSTTLTPTSTHSPQQLGASIMPAAGTILSPATSVSMKSTPIGSKDILPPPQALASTDQSQNKEVNLDAFQVLQ